MVAKLIRLFERIIIRLIRLYFYLIGLTKKKSSILFIPHSSMCKYDKYDIINYRSDSAFTFFNYIVTNNLLVNRRLYVVVSDLTDIERLKSYINNQYNAYEVHFIDYFRDRSYSTIEEFKNEIRIGRAFAESYYIFSSTTYSIFDNLISSQKFVDLSYYSAPFKNDLLPKDSPIYMGLETVGKKVYKYVSPSELSTRLILPSMAVPYDRYITLGLCRNDNLMLPFNSSELRLRICGKLSYEVKTIILYTPTHKDYEQSVIGVTRALMGFDLNLTELDNFLKERGILILCKVHPKQNVSVLNKMLPESVMVHRASENYGLTELMLVSDALMTDYTSGYFDYLLLDKPVIFNFYDFEDYKSSRGFSFDPIESILAGDVIYDTESFYKALGKLQQNAIEFANKRKFIRNLFFTYQDSDSCKRIYNYFFS